jgi:hypothetical protein
LIFYVFSYGFLGGNVEGNAPKELECKTGNPLFILRISSKLERKSKRNLNND